MSLRLAHGPLMQQVASEPAAFDPSDLDGVTGLRWYDFSDETTISDTGGLVDSVTDKFSGGYDLTGTTTTRPTTGATTLNSLNVLDFTADYLTAASAADWTFLHNGTAYLLSAVVKFGTGSNPNAAYSMYGTNGAASATRGTSVYFDDRASVPRNETIVHQVTFGTSTQFNVNHVLANLTCTPNVWQIITIRCDPDNGTAAERSLMNLHRSRTYRTNTDSNSVSTSSPTYAFQIGAAGNGVLPITGSIAEMVITSDYDDKANIENYFSSKYDLVVPYQVSEYADRVTIAS